MTCNVKVCPNLPIRLSGQNNFFQFEIQSRNQGVKIKQVRLLAKNSQNERCFGIEDKNIKCIFLETLT